MKWDMIGSYSFLAGLVLALIFAFIFSASVPAWVVFTMAVLGLVVGFLNVTDEESSQFVLAGIGFLLSFTALSSVLVTALASLPALALTASGFFALMAVFVAPAVALVSVKILIDIARDN